MRDRIEIEKSELPYNYDIVLGADEYRMLFKYNEFCDLFTCTLSLDGDILVYDEPVIYGVPLFQDVFDPDNFPCVEIVPFDESGIEDEVNYDNLGETVFLTIDDDWDEDEIDEDIDESEDEESDEDYE